MALSGRRSLWCSSGFSVLTEWHEQREIITWYRAEWPQHARALRVSMNGLNLGGGRRAAIMIKQMRAQGMVEGESDMAILLPRGGFGCFIMEHKAEGAARKITSEQVSYLTYHNYHGNCAVSTRGVEAAKAAIRTYMEGCYE